MVEINGFPVGATEQSARRTAGIATYRVPGTGVDLPVRSDVAPLLIGLAAEFHKTVEKLDEGSCWGYAYRPVRGGTAPSFHAAGIAIDLNAPRHPLGRRGTFSAAQGAACRRLAAEYGCRWGGDYVHRADEMHFEIILPRREALAMVARLQDPAERPGTYPLPPGHHFQVDPGDRPNAHDGRDGRDRTAIRHIQRVVGAVADGVYGARTDELVQRWQAAHGLQPDGVVGPITWASFPH